MTDSLCAAVALDRECGASLRQISGWYGVSEGEVSRLLEVANARYALRPLNLTCDDLIATASVQAAAARPPSSSHQRRPGS